MQRFPGLSIAAALPLGCAAVLALAGCDLFSTREFRSKPSEIRVLPGLAKAGDSVSFRAIESIWRKDAQASEKVLSRRRLTFAFEKDSLDAGDTVKLLTLTVREDSTGALVETGRRLVRFSSAAVSVSGGEAGGGARWYPLKATAATGPAADSGFPVIPALLIEGWSESVPMGILTVKRQQTSIDTLIYQGRAEESWGITESVLDGPNLVASGKFWYGASGLLKAEQSWESFDWRSENGAPPAKSEGSAAQAVSLRRSLERL